MSMVPAQQTNARLAALAPQEVEGALVRLLPQRANSWMRLIVREGKDGDQ